MRARRRARGATAFVVTFVAGSLALVLGGCSRFEGGSTMAQPVQPPHGIEAIEAVPMGDLAGAAQSARAPLIENPYRRDPQAQQQGKALYIKMNCAGCHGYGGGGGIGPALKDGYWRYGGAPVDVFKSIYEGRAQGMPAWSQALPPREIWKIAAYIESLGGTYDASQFQASIQGDRPGEQVAIEAQGTLPQDAKGDATKPVEGRAEAAPPNPDVTAPGGNR